MDQNLNGLILATNRLVLSRSISVRQNARKLMTQLMRALGPQYLSQVIKELRQTLNKGYQVIKKLCVNNLVFLQTCWA